MISYIYALYDPRDPLIVRYVGKANDVEKRLRGHLKGAKKARKTYCLSWIRSLLASEVWPKVRVLEVIRGMGWQVRERFWIKEYRRRNHPLTNGTGGGDGLNNPTPETLKNLSESLRTYFRSSKGIVARQKIGTRTRGVKLSAEHRHKMSEAHKCRFSGLAGRRLRREIGDKLRGRVMNSEVVEKIRTAQLASYAGPQGERRRLALSIAHSGKIVSLAAKEKMRAAKLGVKLTSEHRQKISDGVRRHYAESQRNV